MKQSITEEQWDELNSDQKAKWSNMGGQITIEHTLLSSWAEENTTTITIKNYPTIGQMIEFLGDDWVKIFNCTRQEHKNCFNERHKLTKLCDALWEAVKVKL